MKLIKIIIDHRQNKTFGMFQHYGARTLIEGDFFCDTVTQNKVFDSEYLTIYAQTK